MNNELLLSFKSKHIDTLIEQTRIQPQGKLEFKMNKQKQSFSFSPPINLIEGGKSLLGVSSFECTNSVFKITDEKFSFSITSSRDWFPHTNVGTVKRLYKLLKLRS